MPDPSYKKQRNKVTGEVRESFDGGKTWQTATAADGAPAGSAPANLGVTGAVPKVPAGAPPTPEHAELIAKAQALAGGGAAAPAAGPAATTQGGLSPAQRAKAARAKAEEDKAQARMRGDAPNPVTSDGNFPDLSAFAMNPFMRGLARGGTFGFAPKIVSGLTNKLADVAGLEDTPRAAGRTAGAPAMGEDEVSLERERAQVREDEEIRAESPWLYGAGEVAGGTAVTAPLPLGKLAPKIIPGQVLKNAGRRAVSGAAVGAPAGAVAGVGYGDSGDSVAGRAATGGLMGGGLGGIMGPIIGPITSLVGRGFERAANRARAKSTGVGQPEEAALRRASTVGKEPEGDLLPGMEDPEAAGKFGAEVERQGLHKGGIGPAGSERYYERSNRAVGEVGRDVGKIHKRVEKLPVDLSETISFLDDEAARFESMNMPKTDAIAKEMREQSARYGQSRGVKVVEPPGETIPAGGKALPADAGKPASKETLEVTPPTDSWAAVFERRKFLDDLAYKAAAEVDTPAATRIRAHAGKLRKAMAEAIELEDPPLAKQLRELNKRYETAMRVREYSGEKRGQLLFGGGDQLSRSIVPPVARQTMLKANALFDDRAPATAAGALRAGQQLTQDPAFMRLPGTMFGTAEAERRR